MRRKAACRAFHVGNHTLKKHGNTMNLLMRVSSPTFRLHPKALPLPLMLKAKPLTPWQKVLIKFGWSRQRMAREMGRNVSRITRGINSRDGLIHHNHQIILIRLAKRYNVDLKPSDLLPEM